MIDLIPYLPFLLDLRKLDTEHVSHKSTLQQSDTRHEMETSNVAQPYSFGPPKQPASPITTYYCCHCGKGPNSLKFDLSCAFCGVRRCATCPIKK